MNTIFSRFIGLYKNNLKKSLPVLAVLLFSSSVYGVEKVWTGSTSTAWNNANNWAPTGVPASGDDVIIRTHTNYPVITTTVTVRDLIINEYHQSGVSFTLNSAANFTVTRELQILGSAQFIQNAGTFNHSGTALTVSDNVTFAINGGTFSSSVSPFTGGSLTAGTARLNFNGGLTVGSGETYDMGNTDVRIQGNFTMNNSGSVFRAGTDTMIVNGRFSTNGNTFYGETSVIIVNGNGTNTINGNFYTNAARISFNTTSFTNIGSGGRFYVNTGVVNFNDSVYVGSNGQLHGGDGTVTFSKSLSVSSNGEINNTSGTINFEGNATVNSSGIINAGSGELNFSGNVSVFSSGVINGESANMNIEGDVVFQNSGTLNAGTGTVVIGGDVDIQNSNGSFNANSSTIYIAGDMNNIGTFNAGTSTVVLNGTGNQTINADIVFYNLDIETEGTLNAGGNVTVLNDGTIGSQTEISIPDGNDQFEVNGDLVDNSGTLAVATNKPFVTEIQVNSSTEIIIVFNEQVSTASAQNASNSTWSGRTISSRVRIDSNKLRLIFTPAISFNTEYTLVFQNIENTRNPVGVMSAGHEKRFTWTVPPAPSTAATNMTFTNVTKDSLTVRWTRGNGAKRIVLMRRDSAVSFAAVNGTDYTANATYAAGTNLGNGQYVVYKGTGDSIRVKGLSAGMTYYFRVVEYNGSASTIVYQTVSPLSGSRTTPFSAPTTAATNMTFTNVTGDSMTVRWTNGNGSKRVVFIRPSSAVTFAAVNGTEYAANSTYGIGTNLGSNQYAIYQGTGDSIRVRGLTAGTTYHFRVVEYNGTVANTVYQTISTLNGSRLAAYSAPTTAATTMTFTNVTSDSLTVRWVNGNGSRRIVIARATSAVSFSPANGTEYAANSTFAGGTNLGSNQYTVYQGTGDSIRVKGLTPGVTYHFRVIEYNGTATNTVYLTATTLNGSRLTPFSAPSTAATTMTFTTVTSDSMTVRWVNGNGSRRVVLMRRDSAVSFAPVNGTEYAANATYAAGTNLGNAQYSIYQGTGDSIRVKGLTAGFTYYFRVVEYNGTAASTVYQTVNPLSGSRIAPFTAPATAATNMTFTNVTSDSMTVRWTNGNGSKRIVIARATSAVSFSPTNGTEYAANSTFAGGTNLGSSQYTVYQGTGDSIRVKGLTPGTTYHFLVMEYNGTTPNNVYQSISGLSGSRMAPFSAPATAATNMTFTNVTSDSMTVRWTNGNGSKRIVIARATSAVSFSPANGTEYAANSTFAAGSNLGSNQYTVYQGTGDSIRVKGLTAGTTYHFLVMEYNGTTPNNVYQSISGLSGSRMAPFSAPATAATNMTFTNVTSDSMTVRWTNGNGSKRIVIARATSAVSFSPANGTEYAANSTFAGGSNLGSNQYTIYQGTGDSIRVKGLTAGTTYHFLVMEYNGTTPNNVYQSISGLSGSRMAPFSAPATAATNMTFTNVTSDSMTVRWTNGNGSKRIVIARATSAVSFSPTNGTEYAANSTFAGGTNLGSSQYTVYQGTGDSIRVKGLTPGTTYHFLVMEYNGTTPNNVYQSISGLSGSRIAPFTAPSTAATNMTFTNVTSDSMTVRWTNGNGSKRIVIARATSAVSFSPTNGTEYAANSTFAGGTNLGSSQYTVYQGTGDSIRVKGLTAGTTYHFLVMEYNGTTPNNVYQSISGLSGSRVVPFPTPTVQTSSFLTGVTTDTTISLSWVSGNGSYRIVLARESSAVNGTPTNYTGYTGNSEFGLGTQLGNGNYVVYTGNGNNVTVTGLSDNKTYHFTIMEFNGSGEAQSYLTTGAPTIGKNTQVRVDIKIFLEGPFNGTNMNAAINNVIPTSQVYNTSPWNYNGTETVASMPVNNVVDWVLVELREASSINQAGQGALVGRRAGLLLSTGKIVDLDGVSPLAISTSRSGRMYVVIYHRTHVAIQSNDSLQRGNKKHVYDFTTSANSAHGTTPLKEVSTGIYAMYCGRFASSNSLNITLADFVNAWNERNAIGYYPGDVNMDGVVDATDRSQIWNNRGTVSNIRE